MLTIGKIGESEEQQAYYEESVAKSREDYYAGTGEAPGRWFGEGARALGLGGESNMEQLKRLFRGQHPETGEQLRKLPKRVLDPEVAAQEDTAKLKRALGGEVLENRELLADLLNLRGKYFRDPELHMAKLRALFTGEFVPSEAQLNETLAVLRHKSSTVLGLDLTFSAPKSLSTLHALGDESLQGNIVEAIEWAAEQAIGYMERESARVVRGHKATKAERLQGVEDTLTTHRAVGFAGIRYRHRVNRLQDPQLHIHYVVGNWGIGPDGRVTALAGEHIFDHAKAGGAVFQMALRHKMRELEPWIEWGEVKDALAELTPELMPPELLKEMSRRRTEILFAESERVAEGMHAGRRLRDAMWAQTRDPKGMTAELGDDWNAAIIARASEWLTPEDVEAMREMPAFENTQPIDVEAIKEHAFGPNGLTANQNTFEDRHVIVEIANHAPQGVDMGLYGVDMLRDQVMDSDQAVYVGTSKKGRVHHTTEELLGHERAMLEVAVDGLAQNRAVVGTEEIEEGLRNFYASHADIESLFPEQENVLRAVATDGNTVSVVEALAGSGKTATAGAMRNVFEAGGYRAFAAGPTGRAVRELDAVGFERPRTLSAWEVKFEVMGPREAIRSTFGDPTSTVLFIDETGMADTRLLSKVTTEMANAGVKVVLIGDSRQLTSVRAGGMHAALAHQLGAYELSKVTRQLNPLEIDALAELRIGNPHPYISFKSKTAEEYVAEWRERFERRNGRVPSEAEQASLRDMHAAGRDEYFGERPDLEVFVGDEANLDGMRQAVADYMAMRERGLDRQQQIALEGRPTPFAHARGMHDIALISRDNTRRAALNNMIREQLTAQGVLTGHRTMGAFDGEELEWAIGDRVIARYNHKGYDLDNGTLGTIVELDETGMTLSDDNGNTRRFDADNTEHVEYVSEHLEHAYALTVHGTQGGTFRWTGEVGLPSEFSRELAYTGLSRARQLTKVYVISGLTQTQEQRKDYATEMDPELDRDKVLGQLARRMEQQDLEEVALLQRNRDAGRSAESGGEDVGDEQARVEFQVDVERYRDGRYRLAGEAFTRMAGSGAIGGEKLDEYVTALARQRRVASELDSEVMQDALLAANDWQRFGETIEQMQQDAGDRGLDAVERERIEILAGVRAEIRAEYPNVEALLSIQARHDVAVAQTAHETRVARSAAIAEHRAAKPEWLTVVGTQPHGRELRKVWEEMVEDLAGQYVDARAQLELDRIAALRIEETREPVAEPTVASDTVAQAWAEAEQAFASYVADPESPERFQAALAAEAHAARIEVQSSPQWLTATLGERPVDPAVAERWDAIGSELIGIRRAHQITSEIDNGYTHAGMPLRQKIGRYRIETGLDQPRGPERHRGTGIGD